MTLHLTANEIDHIWTSPSMESARQQELLTHLFKQCPTCISAIREYPNFPKDSDLQLHDETLPATIVLLVACRFDPSVLAMLGPELQHYLTENLTALAYLANAAEHASSLSIDDAVSTLASAREDVNRVFPDYDKGGIDAKCLALVYHVDAIRRTGDAQKAQDLLDTFPRDVHELRPEVAIRFVEVTADVTLRITRSIQLSLTCYERADVCLMQSTMPGARALHLWRRAALLSRIQGDEGSVELLQEASEILEIRSIPLEARIAFDLSTGLVTIKEFGEALKLARNIPAEVRAHDPELDAHLDYVMGFCLLEDAQMYQALVPLLAALEKFTDLEATEQALACISLCVSLHKMCGRIDDARDLINTHSALIRSPRGQDYLERVKPWWSFWTKLMPQAGKS